MKNLLDGLRPTLLMGPGPSCVADAVYSALAKPTIGHLDPYFVEIMDAVKVQLRQLFTTQNALTLPMSGTGSAGMETVFVNLIEQGDSVLILTNGVFGTRMQDVAARLGATVDVLDAPWGEPILPEAVERKLENGQYDMVGLVHAETSTGVRSDAAAIGHMVRNHGALFILDCVTSLGGIPVLLDDWFVDAAYSGTQKCLSCPPGLAPISFSARALKKLQARKSKVPNWYLDLSLLASYWEGTTRTYHHTAPINMEYALYAALKNVLDEGLDAVYTRHTQMHELLVKGLHELGLEMLVNPEYRLPMLNSVKIPQGVDEAAIRARLLKEFAIEIGSGLGPLAGKIWRIGLMGHTARQENVERLLDTLRKVL